MSEEIPVTMDEFEAEVKRLMEEEGLSFLKAVWAAMDDLTEAALRESKTVLACRKGCSFCCYQPVSCTPMEAEEIKEFLESFLRPTRRAILERARPLLVKWREYVREGSRTAAGRHKPGDQIALHVAWRGKPCPFLGKNGACLIHPVRPMDCRTTTSTVTCTKWEGQEGYARFRFAWEFWANQMVLEEEKRRNGRMEVMPLLHLVDSIARK